MTATKERQTDDPDLRLLKPTSWVRRFSTSSGAYILILDVILVIVFGTLSGGVFFSPRAVDSLLLSSAEVLLIAAALALMLGAGQFDLSLGANLVLSSIAGATVMRAVAGTDQSGSSPTAGLAIVLGIVVALAVGAAFGAVNGFIIGYLNVNSLLATLGTTGIGTGIGLLLTNGADIAGIPSQLLSGFGQNSVLYIPLPALLAVLVTVVLWATLRFTKFGIDTLAIGSSRSAAERAGIKVRRHIMALATLTGLLAGLAGVLDISRFGSTSIASHANDAFTAITGVVIGGTALAGGKVSMIGVVWGTLLAIVLQIGLVVVGVASFWQVIAVGIVLIVAVAFDQVRTRSRIH